MFLFQKKEPYNVGVTLLRTKGEKLNLPQSEEVLALMKSCPFTPDNEKELLQEIQSELNFRSRLIGVPSLFSISEEENTEAEFSKVEFRIVDGSRKVVVFTPIPGEYSVIPFETPELPTVIATTIFASVAPILVKEIQDVIDNCEEKGCCELEELTDDEEENMLDALFGKMESTSLFMKKYGRPEDDGFGTIPLF